MIDKKNSPQTALHSGDLSAPAQLGDVPEMIKTCPAAQSKPDIEPQRGFLYPSNVPASAATG
jgi:hypothetical protein